MTSLSPAGRGIGSEGRPCRRARFRTWSARRRLTCQAGSREVSSMRFTRRIATAASWRWRSPRPPSPTTSRLILVSVPGMSFPFFVHMMKAFKAEAAKQGSTRSRADGQMSSPKQTADIEAAIAKGVKGIVLSPNDVDAMAPALQEAIDAKVPVVTVDRRVPSVTGIIGHVGADNVKGGEAQGELVEKMFPNGATIINLQGQSGASPAIDRNKGLHNVLDKAKDKYKIVFEQTARLRARQGPLGDRGGARRHADAAAGHRRRQRRHGAWRARSGQGAQSQGHRHHRLRRAARRRWRKIRDGELTATIEQFPGKQSADWRRHPGGLSQDGQEARAADHASDHAGRRSPRTISTRPSASTK